MTWYDWPVLAYWCIPEQENRTNGWGKSTVELLADWLLVQDPDLKGFSRQNLWRMRQFTEFYTQDQIVTPMVRELSWTQHLIIMSKCRTPEERQFYLTTSRQQHWTKRELERQINGALFERTLKNPIQAAKSLETIPPNAAQTFKDTYMLEFLGLPATHNETNLQQALVNNLKQANFVEILNVDILLKT